MNERTSKWLLASEALLIAVPLTYLFVLWFADQMSWHAKEYQLNLMGLFVAAGLFAGWWLMISFWKGGAAGLRSVSSAIWAVAVLVGIMSVGASVFIPLLSRESMKWPFGIFMFGLPLTVPMLHLFLERRRDDPTT